jgi:hypothetical protein
MPTEPTDPIRHALESEPSREEAIRYCRELLRERGELLALLREVEWSAGGRSCDLVCPVCGAARAYAGTFTSPPPHDPDCRLAAFLRREG